MIKQKYKIFAALPDDGPKQFFGELVVDVPQHDDGYDTDCVVREITTAATAMGVRDCIWSAEEIKTAQKEGATYTNTRMAT